MRNRHLEGITPVDELELDQKEIKNNGEPEKSRAAKEAKEAKDIDVEKEPESEEAEGSNEDKERKSALNEAREKFAEMPDSRSEITKEVSFSEEKITPAQFREEIKKKAEKFDGSKTEAVVNFVRDGVCDWKICKGLREGFAEIVSDVIIEVLTKAGIDNEELAKIENIIDTGGGYGNNLKVIIRKIKEKNKSDKKINGVCLDNKTSLSEEAENDEEIVGSYQDACETSFEDGSFDLVMATHLLQEIKGIENKKNILREMKRISKGIIVLMVEEKRIGVDGMKDWTNHIVNNFNTKFDVLKEDEYKKLFEELGFTIEAEVRSEPNKITYLLKFDKEKVE
ncbi:MAG: methyltransferase domain-containing protein [Candidatus Pacebacteria bacterium]|nr:methyltransferase domain-containing protein [Candidatus Paceibacterota bacterium]